MMFCFWIFKTKDKKSRPFYKPAEDIKTLIILI